METVDLATIVSILNVVLLISLLWIYVKGYKIMKSKFALGLILFAGLLLIQNLMAIYFQFAMIMYYSAEVAGFALILNGLEALALISLGYISWK